MTSFDESVSHPIGHYARAVLDSLSAHIAILDRRGVILETNRAWRAFAQNNQVRMRPDMINANYLEICDAARGASAERAGEAADGIRAVIAGTIEEFVIDYPCHSAEVQRWFYMRATRLADSDPLLIVVSHENITALKNAEEHLKQREQELHLKARYLEEANIALKVLLEQRERDKREFEENLHTNLNQLVLPYLESLKNSMLDPRQQTDLAILETHLYEMTSPLLSTLASLPLRLTPQEIQVAALVKDGKTSKTIAEILNISAETVAFHRKNIRKKLGLTQQKANLRSYLLSLK